MRKARHIPAPWHPRCPVDRLIAVAKRVIADRNETENQFCGMPTQIRNSTIWDLEAAIKKLENNSDNAAQS